MTRPKLTIVITPPLRFPVPLLRAERGGLERMGQLRDGHVEGEEARAFAVYFLLYDLAATAIRHRNEGDIERGHCRGILRQVRPMWGASQVGDTLGWYVAKEAADRDAAMLRQLAEMTRHWRDAEARAALARAGKQKAAAERKAHALRRLTELRRTHHHLTKAQAMQAIASEQEVAISTLYNWLRAAKKSRSGSA